MSSLRGLLSGFSPLGIIFGSSTFSLIPQHELKKKKKIRVNQTVLMLSHTN
jgi:hypothetical protein